MVEIAALDQWVKNTGQYFLLDKYSKQDSSGNYIVDERAIIRQQLNTTTSNNELMSKLTPEQRKFYNQIVLDIKEEEANKKNWLINWLKEKGKQLSKLELAELVDILAKDGFIWGYKKLNGEKFRESC